MAWPRTGSCSVYWARNAAPYCFLLAFEYYAREFDRESSWTLQSDTDDVAKAQIVFEELKSKWPMVVARFGDVEEGYELPVG